MYIRLKETAPWNSVKIRGGYSLQKKIWKEVDDLEPYSLVEKYLEIKEQSVEQAVLPTIETKVEENINYSKMKKAELIELVIEKTDLTKSEANSKKKAELVTILEEVKL